MITGKNYIGKSRSSNGSTVYRTFNPKLNSENDVDFVEATSEEIDEALRLAASAFQVYKKKSGKEKSHFLNAIADEIDGLGDHLISTYTAESGLPEGRAAGEKGRTMGQLRAFAKLLEEGSWVDASIDTAIPDRQPAPKPDLRRMLVPIGPVVVFGASNFPLAFSTAGGDTASALASGCPVIVKSHPMHAGTGELIASAIIKAAEKTGMPDGVFSNLNSSGIEVGIQLVKHPEVKAVGFTGSIKGGRALYDCAATREEPIPIFAEMGSINPVVILPDALKKRAESLAKTYAGSITLGAGQFCTNPGLILGIESEELTNFIAHLSEAILEMEPSCMLHPSIAKAYQDGKETAMEQPNLAVTANYVSDTPDHFSKQAVGQVSGATFLNNPILHKEVFGPYSLVVTCKNKQELEKVIHNLEGQLTGTLIAEGSEIFNYSEVIDALKDRVGRIIFNGVPTGVEVCGSMVHGGPYPASTDSRFTSVGTEAIKRWVRPFSYQDWPDALLPDELKNKNSLRILRKVNAEVTDKSINVKG